MNGLALLFALALVAAPAHGAQTHTTHAPRGHTTPSSNCGTLPADIEFLLDTSGSVGSANFNKVKQFVTKFTNNFDISPNGVNIGVSTFDTHPRNEFWLNSHTTKTSLLSAINAVKYPAGSTQTGEALQFVRQNAFTKAHGDRDRVANIMIVVTDGRSNNKQSTLQQAAELHKTNVNVFAVGVGSNLDHSELEAIASKHQNVFTVTNFDALDNIQAALRKTACEVPGNWSPWGFYSPCTKSCGGGAQYRERTCTDPAPANGGADCHGHDRETRTCNTKVCPTLPPPTTTHKPATTTTPIPGCGVQPADIVFVVDATKSVTATNFNKMKDFIRDTVHGFNTGPNDIQIGMLTYTGKAESVFHFNTFSNKQDIENAVEHAVYTNQAPTNTHAGLQYATDVSFTAANGARPNASKIAIVITDGKSHDAAASANEAARLRAKGVTVFAIGVGSSPRESELKDIASDPDNQHVFVVNNFDALNLIKTSLQQKACEVKPTMVMPTPAQVANCGGRADIVFLLDKSGSVQQANFNKMLEFVKDMSSNFVVGPDDVQIGVDTFSTAFNTEFTLGQLAGKTTINNAVDHIPYTGGGTNTGPAITAMTSQSFTTAAGHRAGVPKIAVVVTDGKSNNPGNTAAAAQKARDAGIHMLAIGVGSGVDDHELNAIASDPDSQNVYKAATFDSLNSLKNLLAAKACEQVQQTPQNQTACGKKADITFMLDSSGSVGPSNFKLLLSFVNSLAKDWEVGQDKIRVAVEKFSSRPYTEFHLNRFNDKQQLLTAINSIKFQSGGTNTGGALQYMKDTMFNTNNGDRPGVPNIGIVITDGKSNHPDQTRAQAAAARKAGMTLFAVGVGSGVSRAELNEIASDPDSSHVFTVNDFSKLAEIKSLFQQQTCDAIPATLPPYTPTAEPSQGPLVDPCQDHIPNCDAYDTAACTSFARWAQDNCPRTCGYCASAIPTIPPPCVDTLNNCASYSLSSCVTYKPWAMDNCRKYCGFCSGQTTGVGYFGKCLYKGQQYSQGQQWADGCAYDCECVDASTGRYQCYNKCPTYYNLPPQCTLVKQANQCCLQPVCNFDAKYQTTTGQNVGDLNGNKVCVYNGHKYYQSQTWTVGCDLECICDDAGVGLYACQSKCARYGTLPANCKLVKPPGECCSKPECEFNTQVGTFTGKGQPSGPGDNGMQTTPPPCVDKLTNCDTFKSASCTNEAYRPWALENCRKTCNLCNNTIGVPGPNDRCVYQGVAYKQGEQWDDGCEKTCVCENAAYGYYRCDNKCPDYYNMPPGCILMPVAGQCCKAMRCDAGTITGSQTIPNTIGGIPVPYTTPTLAPGLRPGYTLAPGMTLPPYLTPAPGQTLAPGFVPGQTLAPGVTIPWYLTPGPGMTYAPTPFTTPAPLVPGQTLPPGQTIPPYITPMPGQTFAPGIIPGHTLAPGMLVPYYLTPGPGQTYAPQVTNPYATPRPFVPGQTLAPGQTLPPYITPAPGFTFGPGIIPGQTLAPGVTVPPYLTPRPGQTYAPGMTPARTPVPLIPGITLPPGQTLPPYITPQPGQTFAPGIRPGQTLAPGVTVPIYFTPRPGQTYAPVTTSNPIPLIPGITLPPGQTIPSYITPQPGQTFAPGIRPGQTMAPGVTVPVYLTPGPGRTYSPDTTPKYQYPQPGLIPGFTLAPGQIIPYYITPAPGQTLAPGIVPGQTLGPGVTIPVNLTPRPGQTYAPMVTKYQVPGIQPGQTLRPGQTLPPYITPVPGQTFAPGIVPGYTLAPGVTVPIYLTPRPGQTYAPLVTSYPIPGIRPGQTLAPGQTIPPYITPVPGQTFAPGIVPGMTLAPGVTVPVNLTPRPGQTYAPVVTMYPHPGINPGQTLAPGQTLPPYITPVPGQTFAPGIVPGMTLAPGVTVPVNLTPRPGQTYAPMITSYPIPGIRPGQTLAPGQTIPPYITPAPGQTFAPGIVPGQTLAPGVTVPVYLTPGPGQTYAPMTTRRPVPGIIPGQTLAPGQTLPPYITPLPGQTFSHGIRPGQTLAPGVTVPIYFTPRPGQTYAPMMTGYPTPGILPGQTLALGQTIPPYITPAPGQTFAPGIRPGQTLAPGVTIPLNFTPRPGQTYAPDTTPYVRPGLIPGMTLPPGYTVPSYITPVPGQTFAPGIVPGQTLAPGFTIPFNLTPRPGQTYAPDTTQRPGLIPGNTLPPGYTIPSYLTPRPGQTFAPGIRPGQTLAPGVTVPFYLTPRPGQTYAPDVIPGIVPGQTLAPGMTLPSYITPLPGQTFAPGIRPGQTLAPGVTVPLNFTPRPGQTYAPGTTPGSGYPSPRPGLIPGQTLPPGYTIPSYITPVPGQTFAPGIIPGQTLPPGMTVPLNLTPQPGQTYGPSVTQGYTYPRPGLIPGQTLPPGYTIPPYITPVPGQTFAPGIVPGQTLAPGVTVPLNMTPRPGQTYAPGYIPGFGGFNKPGLIPGGTLPPGETIPPYATPMPGQTFAPGIIPGQTMAPGMTLPWNFTPRPGQTYAPGYIPGFGGFNKPGLIPGGTLPPGETIPPYATPMPGQTFAPGIIPGQTMAPGMTLPWNFTPRPGQTYAPGTQSPYVGIIPGQTLPPGYTLPAYITPAPGQTFAPGILPGQTLAPGVTVPVYLTPHPDMTYAPYTMGTVGGGGGGVIPTISGSQTPQKLSGCVYKNMLYQQGQRWTDGCDFSCVCEDGSTGRYRCSPKCLAFNNLDPKCTLQDDPTDPCCKTPSCPAGVAVVPNTGQAITGFQPAINPNTGGTVGGVAGGTIGGNNPGTGTNTGVIGGNPGGTMGGNNPLGSTSVHISGQRTGCVYKNAVYQMGATWQEGCQYSCECVDANTGFYRCTDVCPNFSNLPPQCRLVPDPKNSCCRMSVCDVQVTTTPASVNQVGVATPSSGINYCVYNGRYYRQGEEWADGCSLKCRCEDAMNQFYQCTQRCPSFSNVPLGCRLVPDTKDPQCCKMPECDSVTGQPGSGITGSQTPLGFIGKYAGTGRPNGIDVSNTGYRSSCIYKGKIYAQGQTWADGCDLDCECTDARNGVYKCTDKCQSYAALPAGCNLVQDPSNPCCVKAECPPPTNGQCRDARSDCYLYPKYSCAAPYTAWAKDNCAYYCGFCGTQTTQAPASCNDKLPNCADYGHDGCVGAYEGWARYNCPKFCGFCGGNGQVTTASSVIVVSGQPAQTTQGQGQVSGTCQDKLPNCNQYGQESCIEPYRSWAIDNCPARCNLCDQVGNNHGGVVTAHQNSFITGSTIGCYYKGRIYAHGSEWEDGCDYNCTCVNGQTGYYRCGARCLTYDSLPAGCVMQKPAGQCCSVPVCDGQQINGQTKGCLYKGAVHPAGTQWNDGCDYKCSCLDGNTGQYQCTARCVTWNLPAVCTLEAPAAGKCCPTPRCPAGYTINYPPGYVAE